jgi:phosphoribosylamine-glycine ligase
MAEARENAYAAAAPIEWEGMQLRHDIAARAAAGVAATEGVR